MLTNKSSIKDFGTASYLDYLIFVSKDIINKIFNLNTGKEILENTKNFIITVFCVLMFIIVLVSFPVSFPVITYFRWRQARNYYNKQQDFKKRLF